VKYTIQASVIAALFLVASTAPAVPATEDTGRRKLPLNLTKYSKQLSKDKVELKSQDYADLDGDGLDEMVLLTQDKSGARALVFIHQTADGSDYAKVYEYALRAGASIESMETDDIAGIKRPQVLMWLREESPDEISRMLSIHGFKGSFHAMFEYQYIKQKDQAVAEAAEHKMVTERVIKLGATIDEPRVTDQDNNGSREIIIPAGKKTIEFVSKSGGKVVFVTGARYEIYRYKNGMYVKDEKDMQVGFMSKPVKPRSVDVSSESFDKKSKMTIGPAVWVIDDNIGTAWVPGGKKDGVGEWVKVWYDDLVPMRSLIIIPGCMDSPESWESNNRIKVFTLEFSNGESVKIDRTKDWEVRHPILGIRDVPRAETKGALQTLMMFDENFKSRSVRFEINEVEKGPKGAKTCLPEMIVY
jgi:hypothetical protein